MGEHDGSAGGGRKSKGSALWDHARTVGQGVLERLLGSTAGVRRSVDRNARHEPQTAERKAAAKQIQRSLTAWRDRAAETKTVQRKPQIPSGAGSPLPAGVQAKMEGKLGADLSSVKIHTGGDSERASEGLNAKAFTVGSNVHFGTGQFDPSSKEGEKLLAHELTHVVQGQQGGVQRKSDEEDSDSDDGDAELEGSEAEALDVSDPDDPSEKEADEVAENVVEGGEAKKPETQINAKLSTSKIHRRLQWSGALAPVQSAGVAGLSSRAAEADRLSGSDVVKVEAMDPGAGAIAKWQKSSNTVMVRPLPPRLAPPEGAARISPDVMDRGLSLVHELQHVCDSFQTANSGLADAADGLVNAAPQRQIQSEINAHAQQVKAAREARAAGQPVPRLHRDIHNEWTANTFAQSATGMFNRIKVYLNQYGANANPKKGPYDDAMTLAIVQSSVVQGAIREAFATAPPTDPAEPARRPIA